MGKLVVTEFVSVDGVFEDPGGAEDYEHGGWTFEYDRGDDGNKFKLDELMEAEVQLLGRNTYEGFAEAWPSREGASPTSSTATRSSSSRRRSTIPSGRTRPSSPATSPTRSRSSRTRPTASSWSPAAARWSRTLLETDLVDELRLMVFPTVLGRGKRLFPDGIDRLKLKLTERNRRAGRRPGADLRADRVGGRDGSAHRGERPEGARAPGRGVETGGDASGRPSLAGRRERHSSGWREPFLIERSEVEMPEAPNGDLRHRVRRCQRPLLPALLRRSRRLPRL